MLGFFTPPLAGYPHFWRPRLTGPQANGLVFWAAAQHGNLYNIVTRGSGQHVGIGTARTTPLMDVTPEFGLVPQSQYVDASGGGFFDLGLPGPLDGLEASTLTIAYWVYPVLLGYNGGWWGQGDGSTSSFCETNGSTAGIFFRGPGDWRNTCTELATVRAWQHLAWTTDGAALRYYKNGVEGASYGASPSGTITAAATSATAIGGAYAGSGGVLTWISAFWADFRVYRRTLSALELRLLYAPATRWDLYAPVAPVDAFAVAGAPAGRTTRNTHAWPLGMNHGMHHWHNG